MKNASHVTWNEDTTTICCDHCGDSLCVNMPQFRAELILSVFTGLHRDCPEPTKPSPVEPEQRGDEWEDFSMAAILSDKRP